MAIVNRKQQSALAQAASKGRNALISELDTQLVTMPNKSDWYKFGTKLSNYLKGDADKVPFTVFAKGNGKLPFFSFSAVPVFTCPGMGACESFCYSFKSWRYPCALYRQLLLTVLVKEQNIALTSAFNSLPQGATIRLYVDGDFDSMQTLEYWFNLLRSRPDIRAYGYSKSWPLFTAYKGAFPTNYKLNLSSGGKHTDTSAIAQLPITRGEFIAVTIDKQLQGKYDNADYKSAVRTSAKKQGIDKAFICPGKCGTCTKKGHACGLDSFTDIPIVIGIH